MANPNFNPSFSSNAIWRDLDDTRCLTDDLDTIESDISDLETGKADIDHTHTGYAATSDVTALQTLVGDTAVSTQISNAVSGKVDKVDGKELSSNDYTNAEKTKLAGIEAGANAYTLPTAGSTLGGVKTTSTVTSNSGYTACPIISGVPYYKDTNTTYTSLKNPYALTLQFNGTTNKTYDGSSAQTFNVTPAAIGVADYVVSQGTSGNWRYRKWNSGLSEAWYYINLGDIALTTVAIAGVYVNNSYVSKSVSTPSGVFSAIPMAVGNVYSNGYAVCNIASATKDAVVYRLWCPYSTTAVNCCISIHVVGQWK